MCVVKKRICENNTKNVVKQVLKSHILIHYKINMKNNNIVVGLISIGEWASKKRFRESRKEKKRKMTQRQDTLNRLI